MKHLVEIDDTTETGKSVFELLKTLSKTNTSIDMINDEDIDLSDTITFDTFAKNLLETLNEKLKNK
ncbi:MAG: hypothetical protein EBZ58_05625 [Bacteroidetes bacterium]|nr:hypothetical protein [Bacteroidota bacterium]